MCADEVGFMMAVEHGFVKPLLQGHIKVAKVLDMVFLDKSNDGSLQCLMVLSQSRDSGVHYLILHRSTLGVIKFAVWKKAPSEILAIGRN